MMINNYHNIRRVIGLMSGTSLDAIDVALIETDGERHISCLAFSSYPIDDSLRTRLFAVMGRPCDRASPLIIALERDVALEHARAIWQFRAAYPQARAADLVGFHGQTIWHNPRAGETVQLGDGALLAQEVQADVVCDFRAADVAAGGQGAPLVPLFHQAMADAAKLPLAIINIGGVANITFVSGTSLDDVMACDIGPGNALIDDWVRMRTGQPFDADGALAAQGVADRGYVERLMADAWFAVPPPKSLDRNMWANALPHNMSIHDGAATLTLFSACAIARALRHLPTVQSHIYISGGGGRNKSLCCMIAQESGAEIKQVAELGWNADAVEAQAFAWLAVRSCRGLPLSVPSTTGAQTPTRGGVRFTPVK